MARRLDKTLIDYLVIAISPILIMVLITSLIYFLLEVFYQGPYEGRLRYILTLFVAGAVLVGRISIEEDRERASLFAIPLALAIFVAVNQFVDLGILPNCGLIALIWWCADKLTWDCTLIDETEPDSGEGLMEAVGLDEPANRQVGETPTGARHAAPDADRTPAAGRSGKSDQPASAPSKDELESTTARDAPPADLRQRIGGWWKRFVERRRRPHAPGLWVVYFSLAALPLFGVGQLFIPSGNLESRQYAFRLLFVYVASGLALLLATSFLGLRRYLRQRRVEMPVKMVNVWLVTGCALILAVMGFAVLLPRPNAEYAISQVPIRIGSPSGQKSSRYGVGGDGVREDRPWARTDKIDEKGSRQSNQPGDKGQGPSSQRDTKGGGQPGKQGQPGQQSQEASPPDKQEGQSQPQSQPGQQGKADQPAQTETKTRDASQAEPRKPDGGSGEQSAGRKPQADTPQTPGKEQRGQSAEPGEPRDGRQPPADSRSGQEPRREPQPLPQEPPAKSDAKAEPDEKRDEQGQPQKQEQKAAEKQEEKKEPSASQQRGQSSGGRRPWPQMPKLDVAKVGDWFSVLAKLVLYGVLIALAGWWLWRHWAAVLAAIRDFFVGWGEFWRSLFGGRKKPDQQAPAAAAQQPRLPRFADYVDPFLAGRASRYTPAQLVSYTFLALEAWARENGCARQTGETPHEFASHVALRAPALADGARTLADLYCQVAYASGRLPASSVEQLRQVWLSFPAQSAGIGM